MNIEKRELFLSGVFIARQFLSGAALMAIGVYLYHRDLQYMIVGVLMMGFGLFLLGSSAYFFFSLKKPWLVISNEGVKENGAELIPWSEMRSIAIDYDRWNYFVGTFNRGMRSKKYYLYIDLKSITPDFSDSNFIKIKLDRLDVKLNELSAFLTKIAPQGTPLKIEYNT